ncbi:hypothetical protein ABIB36_004441 [Rhodococcus sp. UYP9]
MNQNMILSTLTTMTGLDVFDYLDKEISVPIIDGMQAQGDLIVVPYACSKASSPPGCGRESTTCPCPESSCCAAQRVEIRTAS